MKKKIYILLAFFVLVSGFVLVQSGCSADRNGSSDVLKQSDGSTSKSEVKTLTIAAVGDIMMHGPQLSAQYKADTGQYDFTDNFKYVKPYIEDADFAVCNLETTFGGGKYSGYPMFNSPDTLADALKNAGFDLAFTSNNHMLDTGYNGVKRTIDVLRNAGLSVSGSQHEDEKNYIIQDIKGVKVAFVGYTYRTPNAGNFKTINGNLMSPECEPLVNSFGFENLDSDLEDVENTIQNAKKAGAQVVVAYMHWGSEYQRYAGDKQKYIAERLADFGSDVIFASHPHVEQEYTEIKKGDKKVPVFYSMGNFISNQRRDNVKTRYAEQGDISRVKMEIQNGKIIKISADIVPTWVNKYKSAGKYVYEIIPLDSKFAENPSILKSGNVNFAREALADHEELFGTERILTINR